MKAVCRAGFPQTSMFLFLSPFALCAGGPLGLSQTMWRHASHYMATDDIALSDQLHNGAQSVQYRFLKPGHGLDPCIFSLPLSLYISYCFSCLGGAAYGKRQGVMRLDLYSHFRPDGASSSHCPSLRLHACNWTVHEDPCRFRFALSSGDARNSQSFKFHIVIS